MRSLLYLSSSLTFSTALLAGCGGSNAPTSTAPPPPVTPTYAASAQYAYVATTKGFVDEYSISASGQWTQIGSATPAFSTDGGAALAIDSGHRFLYSLAGGEANSYISMFTITPGTGLLVPTSPAYVTIAGTLSQGIAVDGLGKFVYTADTDSNTVTSLVINQTTGVLTPTSVTSIAGPREADGVNTDASGKYVYVSGKFGNINEYVINQTTGNLTPNNPATADGGPGAFVGTINAAGTYFYSPPGQDGDYIAVLSIDPATGVLSGGADADTTTASGPSSVALTSDGKYAYVANRGDNTLAMYTVAASTGLLTSFGATVPPGSDEPNSIVIDPSGQLAYVSCFGGDITIFGIEADGTLTQVGSVADVNGPQVTVLVPR
jgi:6-phosphogluconolactonase (cycloisomerase 2 family)